MRYLVTARVLPGKARSLLRAIRKKTLGRGSIAGGEYLRDMDHARLEDGNVQWVEVCFCPEPLQEERPYWEEFFELVRIKNAHSRARCRDLNGEEPWACTDCDCTRKLEARLENRGERFLDRLKFAAQRSVT